MSDLLSTIAEAADKAADYSARAARYDALVVKNRALASRLELFIAVAICVLGVTGSINYFDRLAHLGDTYETEGPAAAAWDAFEIALAFGLGVATAFVGAVQPRDKMAAFGAASDACAAVASVNEIAGKTRLVKGGDPDADLVVCLNLVANMLTTLEATATDNQPPLPAEPAAAREKVA